MHFGPILFFIASACHPKILLYGNYNVALFMSSWRGGGVAALLRCWIRRARPCACAWRTEFFTLTFLLIFLSCSYPS